MQRFIGLIFFYMLVVPAVAQKQPPAYPANAAAYVQTLKKLTDVMVGDVTGPCAAARYYAYANLAAYEIVYQQAPAAHYLPLKGLLKDYPDFSSLSGRQPIDAQFTCLYALLRMGEELLPSGYLLEEPRNQLVRDAQKRYRLGEATLQASRAYADSVVKRLVKYAAKDGYVQTSGYMRYTPVKEGGGWKPTPPAYSEAYEPHWSTLRPFLLDSAAQFRPLPPVAYSEQAGTPFYQLAREVYDTTRALSPQQTDIANYWDCNPFFLNQKGHISFGTKKISPGGHWMGITGIVCTQKKLSLAETVRWHTLVGLTMSDAFISCWSEKYRSNRIRPETYINEHLDRSWRPLLQTPPFPEYTSGHSVVSASVAAVLTQLAGDAFSFTDTSEMEFGLPARTFRSFRQAAQEAAISRLYGGIHFRDAIENGMVQGERIGQYVIQKLALP